MIRKVAIPELPKAGTQLFLQNPIDTGGEKFEVTPSTNVKSYVKANPNLAIYTSDGLLHPIVDHILKIARNALSTFQDGWSAQQVNWEKADSFYWMNQKRSRMPELTRAEVSASTFQIVVCRLCAGAYMVTFPNGQEDELPIKFYPAVSIYTPSDDMEKKGVLADALNMVALEHMRKNGFAKKYRKVILSTFKYATSFAYVPWSHRIEMRKRYEDIDNNETSIDPQGKTVYTHKDTGEQSSTPWPGTTEVREMEHTVADWVDFEPIKPSSIYIDGRIDDMDRQPMVLWRSDLTRPEIAQEARAGKYKNIDQITQLQRFNLYVWENQVDNQERNDAGQVTTDSLNTEVYERWQCWLLLPRLDVKETNGKVTSIKWNQNAPERRYLMETVGGLNYSPIVVRLTESPYWSNGVPFLKFHSHEDDVGAYHRGLVDLLDDQQLQEQVAKGQLMDNRTLRNFRPISVLAGRVRNKSLKIGHNTAFQVTSQDAIKQLDVQDLSQTIENTLNYVKNESESIAQVPKFMLGQPMGGRTTAEEFASVRDQGSAPSLSNYKDLNMQIVGGWLRKFKEYIPQMLDKEVAIKANVRGQDLFVMITADEFDIDMELQEIAITAFDSKNNTRQLFMSLIGGVLSSPMFAGMTNPIAMLIALFKMFPEITPNPEQFINKDPQIQAMLVAFQTGQAMPPPPPPPNALPMPSASPAGGPAPLQLPSMGQ